MQDDMPDGDWAKVMFRLPAGHRYATENLWALREGDGLYRIQSVPWFVYGIAMDDVVRAEAEPDGAVVFRERVRASGRMTLRVTPRDDGPLAGDVGTVVEAFERLGVDGEGALPVAPIVAFDVDPGAPLREIRRLLAEGEADGRWYFEEASVSDAWRSA